MEAIQNINLTSLLDTLITSVDGEELDALVKRLAALPGVRRAFWSPSTTE
jgi:hypothetical protein